MKHFDQWLLVPLTLCLLALGIVVFVPRHNNPIIESVSTTTYTATSSPVVNSPTDYQTTRNPVKTKTVYNLKLTSDNTVLLLGEINNDNALEAARELQEKAKHNKEVFLLLNSPGGSVLAGLHVVNVVENSHINTICIDCASMASIIFEYGKTRFILGRGILMFHNAAGSLSGSFNQIRSRFTFFDNMVNKLNKDISARAGVDYLSFKNSLADEIWLDGFDALDRGYADKLAMVSLNVAFNNKNVSEQLSKINVLKDKITINVK